MIFLFAIFLVILLSDNLEILIPLSFFSFFDIFLILLIALFSVSKIRWKFDGEREKSFFDVFGLALFSNMLSLSKGVLLCGVLLKSEGVSKELFLDMFLSILFLDVGVFSLTDKGLSFGSFSFSILELRISGVKPSISFSFDTRGSFPCFDCVSFLLGVSIASLS